MFNQEKCLIEYQNWSSGFGIENPAWQHQLNETGLMPTYLINFYLIFEFPSKEVSGLDVGLPSGGVSAGFLISFSIQQRRNRSCSLPRLFEHLVSARLQD